MGRSEASLWPIWVESDNIHAGTIRCVKCDRPVDVDLTRITSLDYIESCIREHMKKCL